jgi:hypothetical protein
MKGTFAPKATDNNANRSDPARTEGIEVATAMKSIKSIASGKKLQKPTGIDSSISTGGADEWRVETLLVNNDNDNLLKSTHSVS